MSNAFQRVVFFLGVILSTTACSSIESQKLSLLTMERTKCFGDCPAYSVKISGDGEVIFTGDWAVDSMGEHRGKISPDRIALLETALKVANFEGLKESYASEDECKILVTCMAGVTITLKTNNSEKSVYYYTGCSGAPRILDWLIKTIDIAAETNRWIGDKN